MNIRSLVALLLFVNLSVFGQSLRVVTEDLPPLQIITSNQQLSGAMVELTRLLLTEAKLSANIEVYPWARSYQIALTEPNTLIFSMLRSPSREHKFQWIGKIYRIDSFFMALKDRKDIVINNIPELRQYAVGATRDDLAEQYLLDNQFKPNENLYLSKKYDTLWTQLYQGRTDLVFTNSIIWRHETESIGLDPNRLKIAYQVEGFSSELYLAASLDTPKITVERLQAALTKVKADGRYQQIIDRWQL